MAEVLNSIRDAPITASLVVDEQGSHIGPDGTSKSIGGESDFRFLMQFRKRSRTILTTGKTARLENYRVPSSASLVVLTRSGVNTLPQALRVKQVRLIGDKQNISPSEAVEELLTAENLPIHIEFGPSALIETLNTRNDVRAFISSEFEFGAANFMSMNTLTEVGDFRFQNLYVTEVSGRAAD
jgi:hypothetical protein